MTWHDVELNRVYHNDVLTWLMSIRHGPSYNLAIIDPPYYDIASHAYDGQWQSVEEYIAWMQEVLRRVFWLMHPTGSVYLWGAIGYNRGYALPKLADWIERTDIFQVRNWITQRNTRGYGVKKGYMAAREELLFMTVSMNFFFNTPYTQERTNRTDPGADGKPRKNQYKRVSDVWIDIAESSQSSQQRFTMPDGKTFPGTKALDLCRRIITTSSQKGDNVLIPFAGTGSECLAAAELGRQWIACDHDYWCVQVTRARVEERELKSE